MIMAFAVRFAQAISVHTTDFGVLLGEPRGLGSTRRRQDHVVARLRHAVHDRVQPAEVEPPLFPFVARPSEDADREGVAASKWHQSKIFVDHFRVFEPLVGVVVAAVEDAVEAFEDAGAWLGLGHELAASYVQDADEQPANFASVEEIDAIPPISDANLRNSSVREVFGLW